MTAGAAYGVGIYASANVIIYRYINNIYSFQHLMVIQQGIMVELETGQTFQPHFLQVILLVSLKLSISKDIQRIKIMVLLLFQMKMIS